MRTRERVSRERELQGPGLHAALGLLVGEEVLVGVRVERLRRLALGLLVGEGVQWQHRRTRAMCSLRRWAALRWVRARGRARRAQAVHIQVVYM